MKSNKYCDYCKHEKCRQCNYMGVYFSGIEAIPMEKATSILCDVAKFHPCAYFSNFEKARLDSFCMEGDVMFCDYHSRMDCWIHAIREGWFDDETD